MSDYFAENITALHYATSVTQKIKEIAAPIFSHTKINNFSYLKFYKNGDVLNLTTDKRWIEYRFDKKIKFKILFKDYLKDSKENTPYLYLWPEKTNDDLLNALQQYDIWNGCNIYIQNKEHIEVFSFACPIEETEMRNFYINNLDTLHRFILYFKDKSFDLIKNDKNNIIKTDIIFSFPSQQNFINSETSASLYKNIAPENVFINEDIYMTRRELECCSLLMRGDSIKIAANKLGLSPRTVETHINNVKHKTSCMTKTTLLDLINKNEWIFKTILE